MPRPLNVFAQTGRKKEPHGGSGQFWAGLPAGRGTWGRGDSRDESRPEVKKGETAASASHLDNSPAKISVKQAAERKKIGMASVLWV